MKGNRQQFNIGSFDIILMPISIQNIGEAIDSSLNNNSTYVLQLQKGLRFLKRFESKIRFRNNSMIYNFDEKQTIDLKLHNLKSAPFALSIYKQQEQHCQFIDFITLSLHQALQAYTHQLKQYYSEYSKILSIMANKEPVSSIWQNIKNNLSKHHQNLTVYNQTHTMQIKYSVQIKTQIDLYAQMQFKIKVKTKKSNQSQKHSNSSLKSKNNKNTNRSLSTVQKSQTRSPSEFKVDFAVKDHLESQQNFSSQESQAFSSHLIQHPQNHSQIQKPVVPILPIESILKKDQALSDIIEASCEGQSNINSAERTDRKWKQMPQIKQENQGNIYKLKSHTLLNNHEDTPIELKRNNSLDVLQTQSNTRITSNITNGQNVGGQSLSKITILSEDKKKALNKKNIQKNGEFNYLFILMVLCLVFFYFSFTTIFNSERTKPSTSIYRLKPSKIIKDKIQVHTL